MADSLMVMEKFLTFKVPVKTTFLGEIETAIRLCKSSGLGTWPKRCHFGIVVFFLILCRGVLCLMT